uniref:Uncharacterized protein n=1 Tax=Heterorhabditis bacteriophora TaxID=37862 RepID=A0A1I7XJE5_HETBA
MQRPIKVSFNSRLSSHRLPQLLRFSVRYGDREAGIPKAGSRSRTWKDQAKYFGNAWSVYSGDNQSWGLKMRSPSWSLWLRSSRNALG